MKYCPQPCDGITQATWWFTGRAGDGASTVGYMNYHQEWAGESDELSEFDLADSAEPPAEDDPEAAVEEPEAVPDEVDPADAAEQRREVPEEDDERPE
ncbi:hypothetical protein ADL26_16745, partial [Thermoactinomyces vulgaris]